MLPPNSSPGLRLCPQRRSFQLHRLALGLEQISSDSTQFNNNNNKKQPKNLSWLATNGENKASTQKRNVKTKFYSRNPPIQH
ncbi:mCG147371 [Mus musculus]|jgi:hypothetical protein|nr:mCG147371 [Mus musculus]